MSALGLHHKDFCNTVQMGPRCSKLEELDWTTVGRWDGSKGQVTDGIICSEDKLPILAVHTETAGQL